MNKALVGFLALSGFLGSTPAAKADLYTLACTRTPQQTETRFLKRGMALYATQEYSRAILEFKNAATAAPGDAEPYFQLGLSYLAAARHSRRGSILPQSDRT